MNTPHDIVPPTIGQLVKRSVTLEYTGDKIRAKPTICKKIIKNKNKQIVQQSIRKLGGAVASWLVHSSPDRVVWVRTLAGDIVLCSWARHLTLTVPLSTQVCKWVAANLMLGLTL